MHSERSQLDPNFAMLPDRHLITATVPARLECLLWGRFHTLVVAALGITWILDGLEVTLAGSIAGALRLSPALSFSDSDVAGSAYLLGAVTGGLFLGWACPEPLELLPVPLSHRGGDRRRKCGN